MGTWGTAISSNDTFADVYLDFMNLYNDGLDVNEVTEQVLEMNQEILAMPEDVHELWFAIAKAQWDCKALNENVLTKVEQIIDSRVDLELWQQLAASPKQLAARQKVLENFLVKLRTEREKPKRRKKKIVRDPIFEKGNCLVFPLENRNYGAALVLEAEYGTEFGTNLIAVTRINQAKKPIPLDIERAQVLIKNFGNWSDQAEILWISNYRPKEVREVFEIVGTLEIKENFSTGDTSFRTPQAG